MCRSTAVGAIRACWPAFPPAFAPLGARWTPWGFSTAPHSELPRLHFSPPTSAFGPRLQRCHNHQMCFKYGLTWLAALLALFSSAAACSRHLLPLGDAGLLAGGGRRRLASRTPQPKHRACGTSVVRRDGTGAARVLVQSRDRCWPPSRTRALHSYRCPPAFHPSPAEHPPARA